MVSCGLVQLAVGHLVVSWLTSFFSQWRTCVVFRRGVWFVCVCARVRSRACSIMFCLLNAMIRSSPAYLSKKCLPSYS